MTALFSLVRALLAHPQSIRAVEETELDWRHERREARSPLQQAAVTLRTCLACLRVCVMSSVREIRCRGTLQISSFSYRVQSGSLFMVIVGSTATLIIAFIGITEPEHRNVSLLMFAIGLGGTWRDDLNWRRTRHQRLVR